MKNGVTVTIVCAVAIVAAGRASAAVSTSSASAAAPDDSLVLTSSASDLPRVRTSSASALSRDHSATSSVAERGASEGELSPSIASLVRDGPAGLPWSARPTLEGRVELVSVLGVRIGGGIDAPGLRLATGALEWGQAMTIGVTERLQVAVPLYFAYRVGPSDGHQLVPHGGVSSVAFGFSSVESFIFMLWAAVGADLVLRFADIHQVLVGAAVSSFGRWSSLEQISFDTWRASVSIGYAITLGDFVTVALGVGAGSRFVEQGSAINPLREDSGLAWSVGSIYGVGGRGFPLIRLHVSEIWSIDGWAAVHLAAEGTRHSYLLGTTINW